MRALLFAAVLAVVAVPLASGAAPAPQLLAYADGNGDVYLGSTDGAKPRTISAASVAATLTPLSISPNGGWVLVYDASGATDQLALLPAAGGAATPVAGTQGSTYGTFSPDGRSIVFSIDPDASSTLVGGIYTVPAAGGTPRQVLATPAGATDLLPTISPDGKQIAFVRETTSSTNVVDALELASVAGGAVTQLAVGVDADPSNGGRLSFSPNGRTIVYAGGFQTPGIFTVAVAGGAAKQLSSDYDSWPSYIDGGSRIVFARDATSAHADDNASTPVAPVANDVSELWTMSPTGAGAAVAAEGDFESLAVTPSVAPAPAGATGIRVVRKGVRYTVTWKGAAPGWRVTLKVGAKKASAKVRGRVHRHVFTLRGAKGVPHATVKGLAG